MILTKSKMQVTFVLLFLSWFFNVVTCVDVLPARKRSLYDIAVQERHALIKWDPVSKDNRLISRPRKQTYSLNIHSVYMPADIQDLLLYSEA